MPAGKWVTVPTREEKAAAQRAKRRERQNIDDGFEANAFDPLQAVREAEKEARRKEQEAHAVAAAAAKAEKEERRVEREAADKRRKEGEERRRRAADPALWPTPAETLAEAALEVTRQLEGLGAEGSLEAGLIAANPGLRLEYVMSIVDQHCRRTRNAADDALEPLRSCEAAPALRPVLDAVDAHIDAGGLEPKDLLGAVSAYTGPKGLKASALAKGEGAGALLVLQRTLQRNAALLSASVPAVVAFFTASMGSNVDAPSPAMGYLRLVLAQLPAAAGQEDLRNAVVRFANAAGAARQPALVDACGAWLATCAATVACPVEDGCRAELLTPAGADALLSSAIPAATLRALVEHCAVAWHTSAARTLLAPTLKRITDGECLAAELCALMLHTDGAGAAQLATSYNGHPQRVNAVLAAVARLGLCDAATLGPLREQLVAKAREGMHGARGAKAATFEETIRLSGKAVASAKAAQAQRTKAGKAKPAPEAEPAQHGGMWLLVVLAVLQATLLVVACGLLCTEFVQQPQRWRLWAAQQGHKVAAVGPRGAVLGFDWFHQRCTEASPLIAAVRDLVLSFM